jgi:hypothetical protein
MSEVSKIEDHRRGDTWNGMMLLVEELKAVDGVETKIVKDLTGYSVVSKFKTSLDANASFEFKTEDNTILIPNPTTGELFFESRKMNVKAGDYVFDVELTSPTGYVQTIAEGVWKIFQDVS